MTFMYLPLCGYLYFHFKHKGTGYHTEVAYWKFFICSLIDTTATVLIIFAYTQTTITSVMIIEDFSIPSAVFLSIVFLKVRYHTTHYIAIAILVCGISLGFTNDFIHMKGEQNDNPDGRPILGDFASLFGALFYALENVLQEYLLKKNQDIFNFLGFIGLFGVIITLIEATAVWEFA
jgi:solute carrier family 35 protein F1/2